MIDICRGLNPQTCEPVHLCNTTVVHYNVASSHSLRNRCLSNRDIALKITVQLLINKNAESNKCCVYNVPKICIIKIFKLTVHH